MLTFDVWKDPDDSSNGYLWCTAENSGGAGRKVTDMDAARRFGELKDQMPRFRAHLALQPTAPMYLAQLSLANHELGDRAVRALVEALLSGSTLVQVVELYKNRLGDASAQALSLLLENSPKPGVHGFHLSHNFFTPLGVGLLLAAAARSGFYPARRWWRGRSFCCPLWLRVEQQLVKWEALTGLSEAEQKQRADLLLAQKAASLTKRCQAAGSFPRESLPDNFRLLCMPETFEGGQPDESQDWPKTPKTCSKWRCVHLHEQGWPIVHLPYFWSQNARRASEPEAASLRHSDATWRSWRPHLPVSVLGRIPSLRGASNSTPKAEPKPLLPPVGLKEAREAEEAEEAEAARALEGPAADAQGRSGPAAKEKKAKKEGKKTDKSKKHERKAEKKEKRKLPKAEAVPEASGLSQGPGPEGAGPRKEAKVQGS